MVNCCIRRSKELISLLMESQCSGVYKEKSFRVSIEGNVGCGKSTLINYFTNKPNIDACSEPIEDWRNVQGHNLLHLLYSDSKKWSFTFQRYVQLSRLKIQTRQNAKPIRLFERSLQNNRYCFVEMARVAEDITPSEYAVLTDWYHWIENNVDIGLDLIVYLRSSPEVVYQRMQERARPEEKTVSLEYLQRLHDSYEQWLIHSMPGTLSANVLVIDADRSKSQLVQDYHLLEGILSQADSGENRPGRVVQLSQLEGIKVM